MTTFPSTWYTVDSGSDTECDNSHKGNLPRVPSPLLGTRDPNLNMLNVAPTRPRNRSASMKKLRSKNLDAFDIDDDIRPRTSSLPTKNTYRKPDIGSLYLHPNVNYGEHESDIYRIRNFELTSKGAIINRGDSLRSRSTNSIVSDGSGDFGALSRTSSSLSQGSSFGTSNGSAGNGVIYRVLVLGADRVGKSSIIRQFTTSEYLGGLDSVGKYEEHLKAYVHIMFTGILLKGQG